VAAVSSRQSGFTLIELSMSLVVIGLLVSGILLGKDLIESARIRSQITQYTIAYNTFREKYACIPGDCADYKSIFPEINTLSYGYSGSTAASGNGIIENGYGNNAVLTLFDFTNTEVGAFFAELSLANLTPSYFTQSSELNVGYPASVISPDMGFIVAGSSVYFGYSGVKTSDWNNAWFFVMVDPASKIYWDGQVGSGIITSEKMKAIDDKTDDGLPLTGNVRAANQISGSMGLCENSGQYFLSNTGRSCIFAVKID